MARRAVAVGLGALLAALVALPARAEERTVRTEGVASLTEGLRTSAARQRAVAQAITNAVYQVVAEELPALDAARARQVASRVVGNGARDYVTRFRVIEDLGARPKETPRADATHEYAVSVEATVDARLVRDRLVQEGLLAGGEGSLRRVDLVLEELPSYAAYEAVREALVDQLQAESAVPVEFTAGRAVLAVTTRDGGRRLVERLAAARLDGLRIEPREADGNRARAAVRAVGGAGD